MFLQPLVALGLAAAPLARADALGGQIVVAGDTLVSAMMMFVGRSSKVYILDKVEGNANQINGHSLYASVWDIASRTAEPMDVQTNPFCAAGMHLPNGSFAVFGGNNAVGPGGDNSSPGSNTTYDPTYQDYGGTKAIRVIDTCDGDINSNSACAWYDSPNGLQMQSSRWYPAAEPFGNGSVLIIGGFSSGGYINRNYPNGDPFYSGGGSNPTYEVYPNNGVAQRVMNFMGKTSGLNSYALTYLMSSGKFFIQANYSTILFDADNNIETNLPDMPNQIIRVYPASGANAMLPLTVDKNYQQTILFCGGFYMQDGDWGNFDSPRINPWEQRASADCQRMTPEPSDGSTPTYVQDDDMPNPRTMGQFILLPDGKMLVVNGGRNGTAGYGTHTNITAVGQMPYGESYATEPQLQPAIYDPSATAGSRWSQAGLGTSTFPRLYHSSAILLPDGSVMIAGSNPNIDVNLTTIYPTTYKAEYFYPPYFNATTRPVPSGIPSTISYGGSYFDITVPASSYSGSANDAADNTKIWLSRPGWTTHAMNMGQRMLQLNSTYSVQSNGTIVFHTSQAPPNANLFQPGPAYIWVTINGIPSNGTYVVVGNGQMGTQPVSNAAQLPASVRVDSASGTASGGSTSTGSSSGSSATSSSSSSSHTGAIVGGVVAAIAAVGVLGAVFGICISRRRRAAASVSQSSAPYGMADKIGGPRGLRTSDSSAFVPLQQHNASNEYYAQSHPGVPGNPYYAGSAPGSPMMRPAQGAFDPYEGRPSTSSNLGPARYHN
ncbi:glyoxal oxidase N-terminus-domain-containing protein [Vararia minispora EC-137]|uniref:Glyoxal oxidase N-terminus-domain-containing protein n=1 Tax=Vararia minispora EC-137 TaxID=1314806 RepID=A0ACB8Q8X1_9AGAM|nr:glyoxal oxidase N-terminus-domain-containing protein [Vararia minispora EC-137]